jgi:mRNA-degrading endonuclease RelE of RelBE toxin-antitoxin system
MVWTVKVSGKAVKQLHSIPRHVQERFDLLAKELEASGPLRANWSHFGRLKGEKNRFLYHCHIKSGRPTYVACWEVLGKVLKLIEVYYVGTHEKAPY